MACVISKGPVTVHSFYICLKSTAFLKCDENVALHWFTTGEGEWGSPQKRPRVPGSTLVEPYTAEEYSFHVERVAKRVVSAVQRVPESFGRLLHDSFGFLCSGALMRVSHCQVALVQFY